MLQVKNLNHHYARFHAIKDVSFSLPTGSITGLIGQNGAGKSTILKILAGFLVPDSGDVVVDDRSFFEHPLAIRKLIGYMPETPLLYKDMIVDEYLIYVGQLKGIPKKELLVARENLIEKCGLPRMRKKLVGNLSKGNRQRVALAQALLGNPKILLLDEPTSALDPAQVIEIRKLIFSLKEEGTMVLMSSHILSEIAQICDHIVSIKDGQIQYEGSKSDISKASNQQGSQSTRVLLARFESMNNEWQALFGQVPGAVFKSVENSDLFFEVSNKNIFYPLFLQMVAENQLPLRELMWHDNQLESLFFTAAAGDRK